MDRPYIVVLPGMDGSKELRQEFGQELAENSQADVLLVSYPENMPMGYPELARYVGGLLPEGRKVVIYAESFSGPVGIWVAANHPQQITHLILCASFAKTPRVALRALSDKAPITWLRRVPMRWAMPFVMGRWSTSSWQQRLQKAVDGMSDAVLMARLLALSEVNVLDMLRWVRCPLTYIQAQHDWLVTPVSFREIKKVCLGVRLVTMDGPHFLSQSHPKELARIVHPSFGAANG